MTTEVTVLTKTPDEWASDIRKELTKTIEGFIVAGQLLNEAKKQIQRGDWLRWLQNDVQISPRWAQQLMLISKRLDSGGYTNALLPTNADALYAIASLDKKQIETAVSEGKITPNLDRNTARDLVREIKGTPKRTPFSAPTPINSNVNVKTGSCWHCQENDAPSHSPLCDNCEAELSMIMRRHNLSITKYADKKISVHQAMEVLRWLADADVELGQALSATRPVQSDIGKMIHRSLREEEANSISVLDLFNMFFLTSGKIIPAGRDEVGHQLFEVQEYE